jgi:hypothetical protein
LKIIRLFGVKCLLHLVGGIMSSVHDLLHAGFLPGLFFDPEYGGDMLLRNVGSISTEYTTLYPRRQNSS